MSLSSGNACARTLELELAGTEPGRNLPSLFDSPASVRDRYCEHPAHAVQLPHTRSSKSGTVHGQTVRNICRPSQAGGPLLCASHQACRHTLDKSYACTVVQTGSNWTRSWIWPFVVDESGTEYVLYGYVVHRGRPLPASSSHSPPGWSGTKWLASRRSGQPC